MHTHTHVQILSAQGLAELLHLADQFQPKDCDVLLDYGFLQTTRQLISPAYFLIYKMGSGEPPLTPPVCSDLRGL